MFNSFYYHCLELDQDSGKWCLVKCTEFENEASAFVFYSGDPSDIIDTRLVVGPVGDDEASSKVVHDDGRNRLKVACASNGGRFKQPWPPQITSEIIATIEEGFPKLMAAELAAIEKGRERDWWERADLRMIRRERELMEAEEREKANNG